MVLACPSFHILQAQPAFFEERIQAGRCPHLCLCHDHLNGSGMVDQAGGVLRAWLRHDSFSG